MRRFLIALLALGAIVGFGAGFARLWHCNHHGRGYGWYGGGHDQFENRVADVCVRAAERTLRERAGAAEPAKPAPPPQ